MAFKTIRGLLLLLLLVGVVTLFGQSAEGVNASHGPGVEAYLRLAQDPEPRVFFSENPEWADLRYIATEHGLHRVELICIYGAWILYRNPHYATRGADDFAILSGHDNCITWSNTNSMQPLGLTSDAFSPSVTFFTEINMGSIGYAVNARRGRKYFEYLGGTVKSLVVFGKSQWTITDVKGTAYCLATNFDPIELLPVCKVNDVSLTTVGVHLDIDSITKGCTKDIKQDKIIALQDCEYFGSHTVDPNDPDGFEKIGVGQYIRWSTKGTTTPKPSVTTIIVGGNNNRTSAVKWDKRCPADKELKEFTLLMTVRLNHDFGSMEQILWPGRKEDVWKAELLDAVYQLAFLIIPDTVVPRNYLLLVREFMMYHLSILWKSKGGSGTSQQPDFQVRGIMRDLGLCAAKLGAKSPLIKRMNEEMWLSKSPKEVFTDLQRHPKMDVVIDTTYLIGNLAMGACHHVFDYTTNFWVNFCHVFLRLFLSPLTHDWTQIRLEDKFLLGGYDYDSQHLRVAMITTAVLKMTPGLEPFQRPSEAVKIINDLDNEIMK